MSHLEENRCQSGFDSVFLAKALSKFCHKNDPACDPVLNLTCPWCDVEFETLSLLLRHMKLRLCALRNWQEAMGLVHLLYILKQEIDVANRTCNMCKTLFGSEAALFDHLRYRNEDTVCRTCNRCFRDSEKWHQHVISRTPIKAQKLL
ncbi:hypothetical protein FGADI_4196 [Fusarium gaditjirri]|uniref:C2H2-type domain-containing protein n=1 Tax=Fusarium gaditjirri TaxID=282569 RepID=A0A8H4TDL9_9HYPO|nr:hypothetical protein FGADI_4196 [Fusarium gaditjirri]